MTCASYRESAYTYSTVHIYSTLKCDRIIGHFCIEFHLILFRLVTEARIELSLSRTPSSPSPMEELKEGDLRVCRH
jgi:hypothetical protein